MKMKIIEGIIVNTKNKKSLSSIEVVVGIVFSEPGIPRGLYPGRNRPIRFRELEVISKSTRLLQILYKNISALFFIGAPVKRQHTCENIS